jgi:hypothetical protein
MLPGYVFKDFSADYAEKKRGERGKRSLIHRHKLHSRVKAKKQRTTEGTENAEDSVVGPRA